MLIEGFALGLSSGSYCIVACAPVALPFLAAEGAGAKKSLILIGVFAVGRLVAYIAVGAILGALGVYAAGYLPPSFVGASYRIAGLISGLVLLVGGVAGISSGGHRLCVAARRAFEPRAGAFLAGISTGLAVCPPFVAAAAMVFGSGGGTLGGVAYFLLFFLGTSVWLLPLLGGPLLTSRFPASRWVIRAAMILLGLWFLGPVALLGTA
jgi:sulfite exporter TauE/SafE